MRKGTLGILLWECNESIKMGVDACVQDEERGTERRIRGREGAYRFVSRDREKSWK